MEARCGSQSPKDKSRDIMLHSDANPGFCGLCHKTSRSDTVSTKLLSTQPSDLPFVLQ